MQVWALPPEGERHNFERSDPAGAKLCSEYTRLVAQQTNQQEPGVLSGAGVPRRDDTPGQGYWEKENAGVRLALAHVGLRGLS